MSVSRVVTGAVAATAALSLVSAFVPGTQGEPLV